MKDVTDIFIINEEGILEVNKKEIRNIKAFRDILFRDKGKKVDGDYDGRRKAFAFKEFMYIYVYTHPASIYRDLPDENRHIKSIEHAELPSDWKVDTVIKKAQDKFLKILNMSAFYHSFINANKAVYALGEDLKFFNSLRDKVRNSLIEKIKELEVETSEENIKKLKRVIDNATIQLMELGIKVTSVSNSLPSAFETIEKLKQILIKEGDKDGNIFGGGVVHNRER